MNVQPIARRLAGTEAAEIAEAAMVLPLVFMFLFGIIWFGRAFNIYSTIQQAAQQGAITAARATCATCGNAFPADGPATSNGTVTAAVEAVMKASNLDPTQIKTWNPGLSACPSPPGGGCPPPTVDQITICRNVQLNLPVSTQPAQCGTVVSFQYPFTFTFPGTSLNMRQIILSAQAQSRMEN